MTALLTDAGSKIVVTLLQAFSSLEQARIKELINLRSDSVRFRISEWKRGLTWSSVLRLISGSRNALWPDLSI